MPTTKQENLLRLNVEIKNNPALKREKHFGLIIFPFKVTSRYVAGSPPHLHVYTCTWRVAITILLRNIIGCSFKKKKKKKKINGRKCISTYKY